uniref:Uncharacterized protein n=1 Tax=Oryza glumipatula TaxID=40148 RepID=A0A0D9ZGV7_9ORYZ
MPGGGVDCRGCHGMVFKWTKTSFSIFQKDTIPVHELESQNTTLSNEKNDLERRVKRLEYENNKLSNEKRWAVDVYSRKISTLEYRVWELDHQNTKLSSELVRQKEDTRTVGLLFMNAADRYQHVAEVQIRTKEEELVNMRKASMQLMNAADTYQEVARKQIKAKENDLEDARKAILLIMNAADTYQQVVEKKIKDKVEELRVLGVQKAEMDARIASLESRLEAALVKNQELESTYVEALIENDRLWSVVERLMMGALVEVKEVAAKASDFEKVEIMKELEDHNMKVEEIQTNKNMMKGENDKIQSEVLREKQKHSLFEARVERLKMELDALVKA